MLAGMAQTQDSRVHRVAQAILFSFVLTFALSRTTVLLIMARVIPDFYLYVGQTHVHHLNYGIFLLSGVGAYLLLAREPLRHRGLAECLYGVGLALTFDEFGMWLNLGGSYWQRISFDAVIIIASLFGLLAVAPPWKKFKSHHWAGLGILALAGALFCWGCIKALDYGSRHLGPKLHDLEQRGPR